MLPVQETWTTEAWTVRVARYAMHGGLIPSAFLSLPDPAVKTREVIALWMGHRPGVVYLYTKGVKEEIVSKSIDSLLCVDEAFLTKLQQAKIISRAESVIELVGRQHKRDGMVLYQALLKESFLSSSLSSHPSSIPSSSLSSSVPSSNPLTSNAQASRRGSHDDPHSLLPPSSSSSSSTSSISHNSSSSTAASASAAVGGGKAPLHAVPSSSSSSSLPSVSASPNLLPSSVPGSSAVTQSGSSSIIVPGSSADHPSSNAFSSSSSSSQSLSNATQTQSILSGATQTSGGVGVGTANQQGSSSSSSASLAPLLFHLRVPYANTPALLQLLHSGISTFPLSARDAFRASKDPNSSSVLFPAKVTTSSTWSSTMSSSSGATAPSSNSDSSSSNKIDPPHTISDILPYLPTYFANARPIQFLPHSQKLLEFATPASVSLPSSPHPYLTSDTQILRKRDRKHEEEADRYTVLYYLQLIFPIRSSIPKS